MRFNPLNHPIIFAAPQRLGPTSAWQQHIPLGYLLVDLLKPKRIVELGTHTGESFCAFCQATAALKLDQSGTRCFAVDTFEGDAHTHAYGPEILADLRAHHDPRYGKFSELIQSLFDDALGRFEDGSIDLLHIDGCHEYDAVTHDFLTWRAKLSPAGVVIFHDTYIRQKGYGVWKFWEEWSGRFPSFAMKHAAGLGILAVGPQAPAPFMEFLASAKEDPQTMRWFFEALGNGLDRLRTSTLLLMQFFNTQALLNQWRKDAGGNNPAHSDDPKWAMENPMRFAINTTKDVKDLIAADRAAWEQLKKLTQSKGASK